MIKPIDVLYHCLFSLPSVPCTVTLASQKPEVGLVYYMGYSAINLLKAISECCPNVELSYISIVLEDKFLNALDFENFFLAFCYIPRTKHLN